VILLLNVGSIVTAHEVKVDLYLTVALMLTVQQVKRKVLLFGTTPVPHRLLLDGKAVAQAILF
jgi:hypothetical protein